MKHNVLSAAALVATFANPVSSQEIILGTGYSDYSRNGAEDGVLLSLEYTHLPFYQGQIFSAQLAAAMEVVETRDAFLGVGLNGKWNLAHDWFISASLLPGAYVKGTALNDLGSSLEFRSQIAFGKRFSSGKGLSLAISHKSNASTGRINPGVNAVTLRWHIPLN